MSAGKGDKRRPGSLRAYEGRANPLNDFKAERQDKCKDEVFVIAF